MYVKLVQPQMPEVHETSSRSFSSVHGFYTSASDILLGTYSSTSSSTTGAIASTGAIATIAIATSAITRSGLLLPDHHPIQ